MARLIARLQDAGLRLAGRHRDDVPDMVFLRHPFKEGPVPDCPWLQIIDDMTGPSAAYIALPDPHWRKVITSVNRLDDGFPHVHGHGRFLHACEIPDGSSNHRIVQRVLTRGLLEEMVRTDFTVLRMRHEDGRAGRLHARGEAAGHNLPFVMTSSDDSAPLATFRNITEVLNACWLAESCARGMTGAFAGMTLIEIA